MRPRWLKTCVLSVLLLAGAPTATWAQVDGRRVVVLGIGSNNGLDTEYPLRFAVQDAERFAQVMGELGDVKRDDLHLLANPSKAEFLQELSRVRDRSTPEGMLIVYFSGHGSTLALHLGGEKLNVSELQAAINAVPARFRLLLVDACRGEARKGFQSGADPFDVGIGSEGGLVAIHSTGLGEIAMESNELKAGVFSHLFVSGLRGPADANRDFSVSVSEAYDYAKAHQVDWGSPSPEMDDASTSTTEVTLTRVNAPHSLLVLPAGHDRYRIYAADGSTELVRAWSSPDAATRVALPSDHFVVYRGNGASREVAEVSLPFGGTKTLASSDFRPRPAGQVKGSLDDDGEGGRVRAHEFGVATGLRLAEDGQRGPALSLAYAYGPSGWGPILGLSLSRLRTENPMNWAQRDDIQASAGARYAARVGSFSAWGGVATTLGMAQQKLVSRATDADGQRRSDSSAAVGYGLSASAGFQLTLLEWLQSEIRVGASVVAFGEKTTDPMALPLEFDTSVLLSMGLSTRL